MDRVEQDIYRVAGMAVKRPNRLTMREAANTLGAERRELLARRRLLCRDLTAATLEKLLRNKGATYRLRKIEQDLADLRLRLADVDLAWKRAERLAAIAT